MEIGKAMQKNTLVLAASLKSYGKMQSFGLEITATEMQNQLNIQHMEFSDNMY